jgi:hypothetical protein
MTSSDQGLRLLKHPKLDRIPRIGYAAACSRRGEGRVEVAAREPSEPKRVPNARSAMLARWNPNEPKRRGIPNEPKKSFGINGLAS